MDNLFVNFLGTLKSIQIWFHSAHVLSKGPGFAGDHVHIYGEIYTQAGERYDQAVEKFVALTNNESFACPIQSTELAAKALRSYPTPVDQSDLMIATIAHQMVRNFILQLEKLNADLEKQGAMTLGLSDYLSSLANEYENYFYYLQQRVKVVTED